MRWFLFQETEFDSENTCLETEDKHGNIFILPPLHEWEIVEKEGCTIDSFVLRGSFYAHTEKNRGVDK